MRKPFSRPRRLFNCPNEGRDRDSAAFLRTVVEGLIDHHASHGAKTTALFTNGMFRIAEARGRPRYSELYALKDFRSVV
jgi:hypothetical protein